MRDFAVTVRRWRILESVTIESRLKGKVSKSPTVRLIPISPRAAASDKTNMRKS
jgi:hypothetical protein